MTDAVYDNPATACREYWEEGRKTASITAAMVEQHRALRNCIADGMRPFIPGSIRGDQLAIAPLNPTVGHP